MAFTIPKLVGSSGTFSTPQLWEDGAPANLTTAEKSAAGTFAVAAFTQGETLSFVGSGAAGKFLDTDSTGVGNGTYICYGITSGNPAASDVVTGATSGATCVLSSSTPIDTGAIWQAQQQNQEFSSATTLLDCTGSTSSTTAYKEYTTASGASFRDHANRLTNALRYNASNGAGIRDTGTAQIAIGFTENNCHISNMQVAATGGQSTAIHTGSGTTGTVIDNCIIEGTFNTTSTTQGTLSARNNTKVSNTLVVHRQGNCDHIIATATGSPFFYNCTVAYPDDLANAPTSIFMSGASGTVTVQNCGLFAGDSTKAVKAGSATFNFTTCYSDISGTSGVAQTTYASEFENVNDATRDFRLKTGAAQIDAGTTDATNAPVDVLGTTRPQGSAYDVGCHELVQELSASLAATLAAAALAATGTVETASVVNATLGAASLVAAGAAIVEAMLAQTLADATLSASVAGDVDATLAKTLDPLTLSASVTAPGVRVTKMVSYAVLSPRRNRPQVLIVAG